MRILRKEVKIMYTYAMNTPAFMSQLLKKFNARNPEIGFAYDGSPTLVYDFHDSGDCYSLEFGKLEEVPGEKWLLIQYQDDYREVWFFPTEDGGVTAQVMEPGRVKGRSWYHKAMTAGDFYYWVSEISDTVWDLYRDQYEEVLDD